MSTKKEIFNALTGSSRDGCDTDWCHEVLDNATPKDRREVENLLKNNTENETATILGVMN